MNKRAKRPQMPGSHKLSMDEEFRWNLQSEWTNSIVQFLRRLVIFQKAVLRWFKDTSFLPMWRPVHLWIWIYKHRSQMHPLHLPTHRHLHLTGSDSRGEPAALKALQGIWGTSVRKRNKPILSHTRFTWFWCECLAGFPPSLNTVTHKENKETIVSRSLQHDN